MRGFSARALAATAQLGLNRLVQLPVGRDADLGEGELLAGKHTTAVRCRGVLSEPGELGGGAGVRVGVVLVDPHADVRSQDRIQVSHPRRGNDRKAGREVLADLRRRG